MKRILICFGYKGTNYNGYQKQPGKITIQSIIEDALLKITGENITIHSSGRTDAKVHALKQYAHFDSNTNIKMEKLPFALNTYLPQDIRVFWAKEVESNFHARYDVKKKTYMYVFCLDKIVSPLVCDMVTPLCYDLDFVKIQNAIGLIKGTHNFRAFCSSGTNATDFERTIFDITFEQKNNYLIFKVSGNGFLYNMVRIIIGTLVDIGRGKMDIENITKMLETGERKFGGKTVIPNGLYLFDVEY